MTTILDVPGTNPPNPFSATIDTFISTSTSSPSNSNEAVNSLVTTVTNSKNPAHALWQLWDAFFTSVVASSTSKDPSIALLDAIRDQPPTEPSNVRAGSDAERQLRSYIAADGKLHWSELPRFAAQWRDTHDILEQWRDWDGVRASDTQNTTTSGAQINSGDKYFLRFCTFSAALLSESKGKWGVHPIRVFYAAHDVLERREPEVHQPKSHRMSTKQVWLLDVHITATWVRDGARALWETDRKELLGEWAVPLEEKTELWPKHDGLSRERWELWEQRLRNLNVEEQLDEETRKTAADAANVVATILTGN